MKFKLEIDCDNAAFEDDAAGEVMRILNDLAERIPIVIGRTLNLYDVNGNSVGRAWVEGGGG